MGDSVVKNLPANAGDTWDEGLILGLGRSPALGNGTPLQYSCLENPMGRGAWWASGHGVAKELDMTKHSTVFSGRERNKEAKMEFCGRAKVAIMTTIFIFFLWLWHMLPSLFVLLLFLFSIPSLVPPETPVLMESKKSYCLPLTSGIIWEGIISLNPRLEINQII